MSSQNRQVNGHGNTELRPAQYLSRTDAEFDHDAKSRPAVLIILNSPLDDYELVRRLFDHASFSICADGGANRLHNLLVSKNANFSWQEALKIAMPGLIHGDLDSLEDDVRQRYEKLGVEVSHDQDQYSTDFGKAIKKSLEQVPNAKDILVLGSIGGRVDQGIGLLHEIYREQKFRHPDFRFWLYSEASVSVLLQPGTTVIHTPLKEGLIKRNVGILPLYGKAVITLKGFEWDVNDWPTELGGQVSTSNHIVADQVSVTTDVDVLFTVERGVGT